MSKRVIGAIIQDLLSLPEGSAQRAQRDGTTIPAQGIKIGDFLISDYDWHDGSVILTHIPSGLAHWLSPLQAVLTIGAMLGSGLAECLPTATPSSVEHEAWGAQAPKDVIQRTKKSNKIIADWLD